MKNKLTKALTILVFVSLIIGFVAFKSRYFDEVEQSEPKINATQPLTEYKDTVKKDSTRTVSIDSIWIDETMISSSKSMQILSEEDFIAPKSDTANSD